MRGRRRGERGVAIVFFALTLTLLLVMSAFAVDLGGVYQLRRTDQNAADAGALAAAQQLGDPGSVIANTAMAWAEDNLDVDLTSTQWNSCPGDPGKLSVAVSGANCISYNASQVRVRIPDQRYDTFFGRIVGVDSFTHAAFAIAGLRREGFGGVLPYAVTGPTAAGGFGCLQSNSNGQASPWCGSTSGNFGFLDFSQYGNFDYGTNQSCGSGQTSARIRANTAMGVDHDLSSNADPVYNTDVVDADACPTLTPSPNAAYTQTGNNANDITDGLLSTTQFSDGFGSRLRRTNSNLFNGNGRTRTVRSISGVDDNPLWLFIPPSTGPDFGNANFPRSCQRNQFVDAAGNLTTANLPGSVAAFINAEPDPRDRALALLVRCFNHYRGQSWNGFPIGTFTPVEASSGCTGTCNAPVFAFNSSTSDQPDLFDIQYTTRFGYVPEISAFPNGQSQPVRILRFRALFLYRLLLENGSDIFDPGGLSPTVPSTGGFQRVGETSVFVFPDGMLPGGLGDGAAPFQVGVNRFVRLIR